MGLSASELRRQVTCSPSSHRIFTDTPLAQMMRPATRSSVQRTRLPILSVCRFVLGAIGVFFLLLIAVSQKVVQSTGRASQRCSVRVRTLTSSRGRTASPFRKKYAFFYPVGSVTRLLRRRRASALWHVAALSKAHRRQ